MFEKLRTEAIEAAKEIQAQADTEGRELTDDELQAVEGYLAKADELKAKAERQAKIDEQLSAIDGEAKPVARKTHAKPAAKADIHVGDPNFADDPKKGFKTPAEFFGAVMTATRNRATSDDRLKFLAASGSDEQETQNDGYGGFLVPVGFSSNLLTVDPEMGLGEGQMTRIPMDAPQIKIPARVDKDHSSTVTGGVAAYWKKETAAITTSRSQMEEIDLTANSLTVATYTTEELITDSAVSVSALVSRNFKDAMTDKLNRAIISGTGVGEPQGILAAGCYVSITRAATGNNIDGDDIVAMRARAHRYANSQWIANPDCLPNLSEAHLAGTNGDIFLFQPGRGIDVPDTIMGRPVRFSEYAASVASAGSLLLADWSQFLMGLYQPLATGESVHVRFLENERCFKAVTRLDVKCWWTSALTPANGSNTLSPCIGLAAA